VTQPEGTGAQVGRIVLSWRWTERTTAMLDEYTEGERPASSQGQIPVTYSRPRINPGPFIAVACVAVVVGSAILGIAMSGN